MSRTKAAGKRVEQKQANGKTKTITQGNTEGGAVAFGAVRLIVCMAGGEEFGPFKD